jgi:predicted oxidoreductase (fatty acid repression mutant protein)
MARKEKNIHYIYKTTCNVTGRYYVGMHSTCNLEDGYMGSGKRLRYSIRKYGVDNHTKEILEYLPTREELVLREIEIVTTELIADELCMNIVLGGSGFNSESARVCVIKSNDRQRILKETNPEWVKTRSINHSNTQLKAINDGKRKACFYEWSDRKHSVESKEKISESNKNNGIGEKNSQYGTCWITNDIENKKIIKDDEIPNGWRLGRVIK